MTMRLAQTAGTLDRSGRFITLALAGLFVERDFLAAAGLIRRTKVYER
jgi:hypothetical protein